MLHAGLDGDAADMARRFIDAFEAEAADVDTLVINAAGCGSTLKEYGHLLRDDPAYAERARALADKCKDISEVLDELEPRAPRHPPAPQGRLPRRLSPAARPGREPGAEARARRDSRPHRVRGPRGRHLLRLGRHLQPGRARGGGRAGRPQGAQHPEHPARRPSCRATPAACCRSRTVSRRPDTVRPPTTSSSSWTPPSAARRCRRSPPIVARGSASAPNQPSRSPRRSAAHTPGRSGRDGRPAPSAPGRSCGGEVGVKGPGRLSS